MRNNEDANTKRVLESFSTIKSVLLSDKESIGVQDKNRFIRKCKEAINSGEKMHQEKIKFCAFVMDETSKK